MTFIWGFKPVFSYSKPHTFSTSLVICIHCKHDFKVTYVFFAIFVLKNANKNLSQSGTAFVQSLLRKAQSAVLTLHIQESDYIVIITETFLRD